VREFRLNAFDYLVPQLRKRLFIVGSRYGPVSPPLSEAFSQHVLGDGPTPRFSARDAIGDLGKTVGKGDRAPYGDDPPSAFAVLMRRKGLADVSLHEMPRMSETDRLIVAHVPPGGNYTDIPDEVATPRIVKFKATGGRTTTYGRLHPDRPSYTINTYFRRPNVGANFHYAEPRLITAREAMRFQALPDDFELSFGSQDRRNALIGNAVPSLLGRAVAWAVRRHIESAAKGELY
jgi:DNA (cytosine-5)-methyltransferase 1